MFTLLLLFLQPFSPISFFLSILIHSPGTEPSLPTSRWFYMTNPLKSTLYTAENKENGQSNSACHLTHWHYGYLHHKYLTWWLFSLNCNSRVHSDYVFFVLLFKQSMLSTLYLVVTWLGWAAFGIEIFQHWHWKPIKFLIFFFFGLFSVLSLSPHLFCLKVCKEVTLFQPCSMAVPFSLLTYGAGMLQHTKIWEF